MKKCLILLLTLTIIAGFAFARGSSAPSGPTATATGPFGRYDQTVRITQTRILATWMGFDAGDNEDNNWWTRTYKEQLNIELVNLFTAPNWGPDYDTKINLALATGDMPDVMSLYTTLAVRAIEGNRVIDLTDTYNRTASPQVKEIFAREPEALKAWTVGGKMYGIANTADIPGWVYFWVPKSAVTQFNGGVLPTTFAQVEQLATRIMQSRGTGAYGFGLNGTNLNELGDLGKAFRATDVWILRNNQLEWGRIQTEVRDTWTKAAEWYQRGLLARDFASKSQDDVDADFLNNRCAILIGGTNLPNGSVGRNWILLNPNDDLVCIPIMAADGGNLQMYRNASYGEAIMVSATCQYPDAVMRLYNLGTAISNDYGKPDFIRNAHYDWSPGGNMEFWNRMCTGGGKVDDRIPDHQSGYQAVLEINNRGDGSRLRNMNAFGALQFFEQMKSWIDLGTRGENWELNWSIWNINIGTNSRGHSERMDTEGRFLSSPRTGQEVPAEAENNQNLYAKYIQYATEAIMNNTATRSFNDWVSYYNANGGTQIYAQVREQYRNQ